MSLKHTILGFLKNDPKTGYDLQKKIEKTISHFWPSTQSQIYRTLNEMAKESLIASEIEYQEEKPNKKLYSITGKGEKELVRWLSQPHDIPSHRNQLLVQLFFSGNVGQKVIISNLKHYKAEMENRLNYLNSSEVAAMINLADKAKEKTLFDIIRNNGIQVLQAEIDWTDESIRLLESV
jgi:PadR family transcriptional regulator AphA